MNKVGSIVFLAVLALASLGPASGASTKAASPIRLDDVLNGNYSAASYSGTWVSDTELQYWRSGSLYKVNVETGVETQVLDGSIFEAYEGNSLSFSADKLFVLVTYQRTNIWRHSYVADYAIYDTVAKTFERIFPEGATNTKLMLFQWDPVPVGNSFVYVHENDIYYRSAAKAGTATRRLTNDGSATIINGHSDWVYEEEMFGSSKALWFSKDAKTLAYVQFNDAQVKEFQYPNYGEPGDRNTVYPEWTEIRYPKAGQTNPVAIVKTIDLSTPTSTPQIYLTEDANGALYHYVATVTWKSNTELIIVFLNRAQQTATWSKCLIATQACDTLLSQSQNGGWVDVVNPVFSNDETFFLTILPRVVSSVAKTYRQIVKIRVADQSVFPLTNEQFSVDSISAWDETNNKIYFSATGLSDGVVSPSENQVYVVADSTGNAQVAKCLTCGVLNIDEEVCKSNRASFSTAFKYFLHTCGGPGIPENVVRLTTTLASHKVMQQNDDLRKKLETVGLPIVKDYSIPLGTTGFNASVRLYLPPTFAENIKYPLFIDVYGGPDSQKITEGYSVHWGTSLVTDRNIIYGYIDGRGSGRQSRELMFQLHRKLGTVEIEDQISAAKWLVENTDFIDGEQTAIWGWSYGGYATAMTMARDTENVYKCGISVAPVTSWLYYDTIYTERYMNLPTAADNEVGYNNGEVTTQVENFKNKQFFLVHGNADDNVHYQQSMILSRALEQADVLFYQLSYPDEDHSIAGPGMRRHLYHSLENFLFRDCFAKGAFKSAGITLSVNFIGLILPLLAAMAYNSWL